MTQEVTETNPDFNFEKEIQHKKSLREVVEFLAANGLGKPLYLEEKITQQRQPKSDDTLSRLEALSQQPKTKTTRTLKGIFLPLGINDKSDWLFIGIGDEDSTGVIRYSPPKNDNDYFNKNFFLTNFYNKSYITITIPQLVISFLSLDYHSPNNCYMDVVYRSNQPTNEPEKLQRDIEEDLEKAYKIALERKQQIDMQNARAEDAFIRIFNFGNNPSSSS